MLLPIIYRSIIHQKSQCHPTKLIGSTATQIPLLNPPNKASTLRGSKSLVPITVEHVHNFNKEETSSIIQKASIAQHTWTKVSPETKRDLLNELAQSISDNHDGLSLLESRQSGKTLVEARAEISEVVNVVRYYAGWADKFDSGHLLCPDENYSHQTMLQPYGVIAAITAFNYPLLLAAWKFAPALASGNAIILKPSEWAPLTAIAVRNLIVDDRLKSAFQVVTGGPDTVTSILEHPLINHVSFTGSIPVGTQLAQRYPLKSMNMELGGKNSLYVDSSANLNVALASVLDGGFSNAGQNCCAVSRLILNKDIHDEFVEMLVNALASQFGCVPLSLYSPKTKMGLIATKEHAQRIRRYLSENANDLVQKFPPQDIVDSREELPASTNIPQEIVQRWVPPTLYINVPFMHPLAHSIEIFGPVVCVLEPVSNIQEAIDLVNLSTTKYGLAAGIIAQDQKLVNQFAAAVNVGMVWANTWNLVPANVPFGGWALSGRGKDLGKDGLLACLKYKSVVQCHVSN